MSHNLWEDALRRAKQRGKRLYTDKPKKEHGAYKTGLGIAKDTIKKELDLSGQLTVDAFDIESLRDTALDECEHVVSREFRGDCRIGVHNFFGLLKDEL